MHNVTLWLVPQPSDLTILLPYVSYTGGSIAQSAYYEALLDHIMLVRGTYITIEGLRPGARVYIYDAKTGLLLYSGVAASTTVRIPAWSLGLWRMPLEARVVVNPP